MLIILGVALVEMFAAFALCYYQFKVIFQP